MLATLQRQLLLERLLPVLRQANEQVLHLALDDLLDLPGLVFHVRSEIKIFVTVPQRQLLAEQNLVEYERPHHP